MARHRALVAKDGRNERYDWGSAKIWHGVGWNSDLVIGHAGVRSHHLIWSLSWLVNNLVGE